MHVNAVLLVSLDGLLEPGFLIALVGKVPGGSGGGRVSVVVVVVVVVVVGLAGWRGQLFPTYLTVSKLVNESVMRSCHLLSW